MRMQIRILVLIFATTLAPAAIARPSSDFAGATSAMLQLCRSLKAGAAWAEDWSCWDITRFDDGRDRKIVNDLRRKDPASLTVREEAILTAVNRVGAIAVCSKSSGNAFLIQLDGKPAVVTSGHILIDDETGASSCAPHATSPKYFPNISYYVAGGDNEYALQTIPLVYPPMNLASIAGEEIPAEDPDDVLIFYAQQDISHDRMRDGRIRGAFGPPRELQYEGMATLIGVAPDIQDGLSMLYQEECPYDAAKYTLVRHGCDTVAGSSGSFIGAMEGDELVPLAVHNYSMFGNESLPGTLSTFSPAMNGGVSVVRIFKQTKPQEVHLAYHIQWALHEAGCYASKLDNIWGPGSRRALAAFAENAGIELPGREPSFELLDAVEAVLDGAETCGQHG